MPAADPVLVEHWVRGRSVARGLPQPVADHGGWRVETGTPIETRRYVFAQQCEDLRTLAVTITEPRVFLKLSDTRARLQEALHDGWEIEAPSWMMSCEHPLLSDTPLPPGYVAHTETSGEAIHVIISDNNGAIAAGDFAARWGDTLVYDRIVTNPGHRRLGLGRTVMSRLYDTGGGASLRNVLVATADGRALYEAMGWIIHAPYHSAVRPG